VELLAHLAVLRTAENTPPELVTGLATSARAIGSGLAGLWHADQPCFRGVFFSRSVLRCLRGFIDPVLFLFSFLLDARLF
jgi:hypothetical protein